ncbi:MAG: DUF5053 domain-containing protein [Bacteroidales bacterium]|nr:DUF5053 domain-containing protein [Bacteroidales bacterium]
MDAKQHYNQSSIIPIIDDIYDLITWGDFAKEYFPEHSVSWFYNKMRGVDGNGGAGSFNDDERSRLKKALDDLASRIRVASNEL